MTETIMDIACRTTGVSKDEFLHRNLPAAVMARKCFYRHFELQGMHHEQIARMVEKNRSTITGALNGFKLDYKYNKKFREIYDRFTETIKTEVQE